MPYNSVTVNNDAIMCQTLSCKSNPKFPLCVTGGQAILGKI